MRMSPHIFGKDSPKQKKTFEELLVSNFKTKLKILIFELDKKQYHIGELEESINNLVAEKTAADLVAHGWETRAESMERHIARLDEQIKTLRAEKDADVKFWRGKAFNGAKIREDLV